jgi:uncharacterized protein YlbG (UPF0298 family)
MKWLINGVMKNMNIISRTSLIIYLKHMKHERQIRKFGHIVATNKQKKYVVLYVNEADADDVVNKLMKLKYVRNIDGSPYKYLKKVYDKEKHELS